MRKRWAVLGLALLFTAVLAAMPAPAAAELKVSVSGYVKLDVTWSDKIIQGGCAFGAASACPSPSPSQVPFTDPQAGVSGNTANHDETRLDSNQSRIRVNFSDEVTGVKISGRVEGDFFDGDGNAKTSNSRTLRLRHAFAEAQHPSGFFFLAGQTWTTYMNSDMAQADLVDFNGPAGQIFARQPMIRAGYKMPLAGMGDLVFMVSAEKNSTDDQSSQASNVTVGQGEGQEWPKFVGKVQWLSSLLQVEGAYVGSEQSIVPATGGSRVSHYAWAAQFSGQLNYGPLSGYAHYHHNEGLGRWHNADWASIVCTRTSTAATAPCTSGNQTDFRNVRTDGFYVGGQYRLTNDLNFNAVYGWQRAQRDSLGGTSNTTGGNNLNGGGAVPLNLALQQSIHGNILYKFWQRWQLGIEYEQLFAGTFDQRDSNVILVRSGLWFFF